MRQAQNGRRKSNTKEKMKGVRLQVSKQPRKSEGAYEVVGNNEKVLFIVELEVGLWSR